MKPNSNEKAALALKRRRDAILALHDRTDQDRAQLDRQASEDTRAAAADAPMATVLERLSQEERRELEQIDAALERIKRGEYGRCESCGGAVGGQRLAALPETPYCVECAERAERAEQREHKRAH